MLPNLFFQYRNSASEVRELCLRRASVVVVPAALLVRRTPGSVIQLTLPQIPKIPGSSSVPEGPITMRGIPWRSNLSQPSVVALQCPGLC